MGFLKVAPYSVQPSAVRPFGDANDLGRLGARQAIKVQKQYGTIAISLTFLPAFVARPIRMLREHNVFLFGVVCLLHNFGVSLDEIHNDSTTVRFHCEYATARNPKQKKGRQQPAITWGHSKDHRPDLKQLLFTLTLSDDGGVPVFFQLDNGNTTEGKTR